MEVTYVTSGTKTREKSTFEFSMLLSFPAATTAEAKHGGGVTTTAGVSGGLGRELESGEAPVPAANFV